LEVVLFEDSTFIVEVRTSRDEGRRKKYYGGPSVASLPQDDSVVGEKKIIARLNV
jgi:hypothetical protein